MHLALTGFACCAVFCSEAQLQDLYGGEGEGEGEGFDMRDVSGALSQSDDSSVGPAAGGYDTFRLPADMPLFEPMRPLPGAGAGAGAGGAAVGGLQVRVAR